MKSLLSININNLIIKRTLTCSILKPMIDLKEILKDPEKMKMNALQRRIQVDIELIGELNRKRIDLLTKLNSVNSQRKRIELTPPTMTLNSSSNSNRELRESSKQLTAELALIEDKLLTEISTLPNCSAPESPIEENLVIKEHQFDDKLNRSNYVDHVDICKKFDLVDFEGPARTTGAHFYALKGIASLLEMTLVAWAMNRAIKRGFVPVSAPDCVRERFIVGCGFQPRRPKNDSSLEYSALPVYTVNEPGQQESEKTLMRDPLVLTGTSEMFLAAQHSGQILDTNELPLKYVASSHCFRSEVGHHTAASRGLYRVHQFTKVELFTLCDSGSADRLFNEITDLQGSLLEELNLPFRVLEMARWELGGAASRKWDHEVWMPGRKIWGEVMSTSNCTDYQARRLAIRHRRKNVLEFPYTLNGTACAVPRIIMALMEYGWNPDVPNLFTLPSVLEPFYPTQQRQYKHEIILKFV